MVTRHENEFVFGILLCRLCCGGRLCLGVFCSIRHGIFTFLCDFSPLDPFLYVPVSVWLDSAKESWRRKTYQFRDVPAAALTPLGSFFPLHPYPEVPVQMALLLLLSLCRRQKSPSAYRALVWKGFEQRSYQMRPRSNRGQQWIDGRLIRGLFYIFKDAEVSSTSLRGPAVDDPLAAVGRLTVALGA